jgi:neutral ceramidase
MMRWSFSLFFLAVAPLLGTTGCAVIAGSTPGAVMPTAPPRVFCAGAARVDITPMPGYPQGGHSIAGAVGRGYWTRLWAKAIYVQDAQGNALALVSCDLFAVPAGLVDRTAQLLASRPGPDGTRLSRAQLIVAATHTHHGPGNFLSNTLFNELASPQAGFDPDLFEFLARRIADAVAQAQCSARPALLEAGTIQVHDLSRNRSMEAFVLNPEASLLIDLNKQLPLTRPDADYPDPLASRAVDPNVTVLRFLDAAINKPVALAAFLATHPTSTEHACALYSGELFGASAVLAEQGLLASAGGGATDPAAAPVVALFNGAEGDVSPLWYRRDRATTLDLARKLAAAIVNAPAVRQPTDTPIDYRFRDVSISGVKFPCGADQRPTATFAQHGVGTVGGAEDGRSFLYDLGWKEDVTGPLTEEQGDKLGALDPRIQLPIPLHVTRLAEAALHAPDRVPVGVYRVGPFAMATLPGEFTTIMGRRIHDQLNDELKPPAGVLLIGLAGEFIHYLTTPQEYAAQSYEGASSMYGPYSGSQIGYELLLLARQIAANRHDDPPADGGRPATDSPGNSAAHPFRYFPGPVKHFGMSNIAETPAAAQRAPASPDEGLSDIVVDPAWHRPVHSYPTAIWEDQVPDWSAKYKGGLTPHVRLEQQTMGTWAPLVLDGVEETDAGLDFVTVALATDGTTSRWACIWLPPRDESGKPVALPPGPLRFHIDRLSGAPLYCPFAVNLADLYPWGENPPSHPVSPPALGSQPRIVAPR